MVKIVECPKGLSLAPFAEVRAGTKLIADGGFTCLAEGEVVEVEEDEEGELFVHCAGAQEDEDEPLSAARNCFHGLEPNLNDEESAYVGFWLYKEKENGIDAS